MHCLDPLLINSILWSEWSPNFGTVCSMLFWMSTFQGDISPFMQKVFMPLVSTIFQVLIQPADSLDQVAVSEKRALQKSYYQFLSTIITSDVLDVLKNQGMCLLPSALKDIILYSVLWEIFFGNFLLHFVRLSEALQISDLLKFVPWQYPSDCYCLKCCNPSYINKHASQK